MAKLRVLELSGSHYEMGFQHGKAYADEIREVTEERIRLSCDETWTGRSLPEDHILELAEACVPYHEQYAPDIMQQLHGMSEATGISVPELVIASGFTDFADVIYNALEREPKVPIYGNECTTWMVGGEQVKDQRGMLAQTWDMHATATPYVIMIHGKPDDEPEFMALSLTGCVAMIGMNEAGICVGINNLAGADGQPGVTWPFVCRKIMQQTNIEDALDCITSATLAGGHNYMLMDAAGKGYNVEAMTTKTVVTPLNEDALVHANICLHDDTRDVQRPIDGDYVEDSDLRLNRATVNLSKKVDLTEHDMMEITRNREDGGFSVCSMSEPPFYSETCAAIVMKPETRDVWAVWGLPNQNEYEYFSLA